VLHRIGFHQSADSLGRCRGKNPTPTRSVIAILSIYMDIIYEILPFVKGIGENGAKKLAASLDPGGFKRYNEQKQRKKGAAHRMKKETHDERPGVLFDLDGTLWDATATTAEAWREVLANHPEVECREAITRERIQTYMGLTNEELAEVLFSHLPYEEAFSLILESCTIENRRLPETGGQLYPGTEAMLDRLLSLGYRLFIVSNCQDGYIEAFLHAHRMEHRFTDWECSGRTGRSKGDNILSLMERNGIRKALLVGDTDSDRAGAEYAKIPFIYCRYGFGHTLGRGSATGYDGAVDGPEELPQQIRSIFEA